GEPSQNAVHLAFNKARHAGVHGNRVVAIDLNFHWVLRKRVFNKRGFNISKILYCNAAHSWKNTRKSRILIHSFVATRSTLPESESHLPLGLAACLMLRYGRTLAVRSPGFSMLSTSSEPARGPAEFP